MEPSSPPPAATSGSGGAVLSRSEASGVPTGAREWSPLCLLDGPSTLFIVALPSPPAALAPSRPHLHVAYAAYT